MWFYLHKENQRKKAQQNTPEAEVFRQQTVDEIGAKHPGKDIPHAA
jgi:hypothetical protein